MSRDERPDEHDDLVGWRRFFLAAGLFNLLGGIVGSIEPAAPWTVHGMAPPLYLFPIQLVWAVVALFGVGYLMVWRRPRRHRGIVVLGLGTKILGMVFLWVAISRGEMPTAAWWQPLVADLPWAVGFALFLWKVRD